MKIDFQSSDHWIFLSIALQAKVDGASLRDVIAAADYINHAIPTIEEIEGAVNRLTAARLIWIRNNRFGLTDSGKVLVRSVARRKRHILDQWKLVQQHLASSDLSCADVPMWTLKPHEFASAHEQYSKEFLQSYEDFEKKTAGARKKAD